MRSINKIIFARNELENVIDGLQKKLELSEEDMLLIVEMLLSTSRHKVIARDAYNNLLPNKEEDKEVSD